MMIKLFPLCLFGVSLAEFFSEDIKENNRLLLISFDGFRWDYLDKHKDETKNIQKLAKLGLRAKWTKDQFITKTFPNHWTIATGLYEESHGIVNNHFWDPNFKEEFTYSSDDKFWAGEPIWQTLEKQTDRKSATFYWPGSDVQKTQPSEFITPYDASVPFKTRADKVITWLRDKKYGFISLYVNEPDHSGHQFGPDSPEVAAAISRCDDMLGLILQEVHGHTTFYEDLTIILTSDHGMTQLDEEKVILLQDYLDPKILGEHYIDYYTGGHVWCDPANCDEVYSKLQNITHLHVWRKGYPESQGGIPQKYRYANHYRIPPIVLSVDLPWQVHVNRTSYHPLNGQHGYSNDESEMHPIFIAAGKEIKEFTEPVIEPFNSINLYSFFCKILELEPAPNNGSWREIEHFLKDDGIDWFHLGRIELRSDVWTMQKTAGLICMILGIAVGLFAIFCVKEEDEEQDKKKEYIYLNEALVNDDTEDESSESKVHLHNQSSFSSNKVENQRTFVID